MAKPNQKKTAEDLPFLEVNPPPFAARGLAYLLLLLFLTALISAVWIEIPESISGSFILVPVQGTDPVRVSDDGFIAEVRIADGDAVKRGQTLFVVQSEIVGTRSADFQTSQTTVRGVEHRLQNFRVRFENQKQADVEEEKKLQAKLRHLNRMMELKNQQLRIVNDIVAGYEKLNEEGIASRMEMNNRKLQLSTIELELKQLETDSEETRSILEKQRYISQQNQAEFREAEQRLLEERDKSQIQMDTLDKELTLSEGNRLFVPAPCDGIVLRLLKKSPGTFVENAEALCEIACSDRELQAEVTLPQLGIARIRQGQGVKLLYDAFPYQHYGVKLGTVAWVSPAGIAAAERDVFPVRVRLQDQTVFINGSPRPLLPGMQGKAHIVVDRRSLISYALAPIRQLREMMATPPPAK